MRRSKALSMLFSIALFGALALAPSGCSTDSANSSSPELGLTPSGYDPYPPAMVSGLEVSKATEEAFKLTWTANTDIDLAGYRVYVFDPSPYRDSAYRCPHGAQVIESNQTHYTYQDDISDGFHYFKIVAVDTDGNESIATAPLEFSWESASTDDEYTPKGGNQYEEEYPQAAPPTPPWEGKEDYDDDDDGSSDI